MALYAHLVVTLTFELLTPSVDYVVYEVWSAKNLCYPRETTCDVMKSEDRDNVIT